jgi:enoyl-CoA hydratase/carnithine racemase
MPEDGGSGFVTCDEREGRHHIVLRRQAIGNALSARMIEDLDVAFDRCRADGARLIVFEGEGRHFCTGFDLSDLDAETDASLLLRFVRIEQFLQKVHASPVMTAAIGKGRCFGAGADLFTCCDHRIAMKGATFAFPGTGFGLILGTARLSDRIGGDNARASLLAGTILDHQAAYAQKLATDLVVDDNELEGLLSTMSQTAMRLDAPTAAAILSATKHADHDRQLADLVRSASRGGLRDRIVSFRARQKARTSVS